MNGRIYQIEAKWTKLIENEERIENMVDVSCDTNNLIETLDATCDTNNLMQKFDVTRDINVLVELGDTNTTNEMVDDSLQGYAMELINTSFEYE